MKAVSKALVTNYLKFIFFLSPGKQLVRYSIVSGDVDNRFTIEPHTGAIRTSGKLDRETTPSYLLNIRAATSNSASYDQTQVRFNSIASVMFLQLETLFYLAAVAIPV